MKLERVEYARLNSRQKENYNFQKLSAVLADYGFVTFRLSDDWSGADLIALHISGEAIRIQLKSRVAFHRKYQGKDIFIAFRGEDGWYLYPHDRVLARVLKTSGIGNTRSWKERDGYSIGGVSKEMAKILKPYRICEVT